MMSIAAKIRVFFGFVEEVIIYCWTELLPIYGLE